MELGYFAMPSHPPECGLKEGHDWDLQVLRWLDELGYQEAWIGEHHTAPWEPHPSPDLLVAQALLQTKESAHRPRWLPAAVSPSRRARQPRRDARPHLERATQFRCCCVRPAERLGDVQCRRHVRAKPRHDPRGTRDHPEDVDRAGTLDAQGQVLDGHQSRTRCSTS